MHGLWVAMSDFSLPDGFLRDSNAPFLDVYSQRVQQLLKKLAAWTRRVLGFIERSTHMTNMSLPGSDTSCCLVCPIPSQVRTGYNNKGGEVWLWSRSHKKCTDYTRRREVLPVPECQS
ncbi:uncharacterized protein LOC142777500 isoform X1 [Rhipicephalus microplus]|uniref:uncharacterized protein LOC142777500 isoform X1 n=1 Tax=Rhipicephalus microplus TaxID=6941 RepID=UPI003F6AEBF0